MVDRDKTNGIWVFNWPHLSRNVSKKKNLELKIFKGLHENIKEKEVCCHKFVENVVNINRNFTPTDI